eukprot:Sspe_Gene.7494::Locus_2538_Transcript_1_1_Confidence_1.000_Length_1168::g.7494::m.7494/K01639/E4.1.3.3, nanA, NPL; N-acetylneuraminate lyase
MRATVFGMQLRAASSRSWPRISGLVCPPFTPYTAKGDVNFDAISKQIDIIAKTGCSAIFLGGTASEGPSQSVEERKEIAKFYAKALKERNYQMKLIIHVGTLSTRESEELAGSAEAINADAIASVTPAFFKPANVQAMVDWFQPVAAAAPNTPFYYYHMPMMTGVPPTVSVKKFLEEGGKAIPTLHGVKYTSQNLAEYADCAEADGGRYDVMAGLSEQLLAALAMGAKSSVSVPYNLPFTIPYYQSIIDRFNDGDMAGALAKQKEINRLTFLLQHGGYGNPISLMRAMMKMETGVDFGDCRPPLPKVSEATYAAVEKELHSLGFLA